MNLIIETKSIKSSVISSVNDPYEISAIRSFKGVNDLITLDNNNIGKEMKFICLSSRYDCPVMWGIYGDKNNGVCIGVKILNTSLFRVRYVRKLLRFNCNRKINNHDATEILRRKFKKWSYEKEYRLFTHNDFEKFSDLFQLKEIMFGYKVDVENIKGYYEGPHRLFRMFPDNQSYKMRRAKL